MENYNPKNFENMSDYVDYDDEMDMPTPCVHCDQTFDLNDGYGSEKWHENITICPKCHEEEEKEIEEDERWEGLNSEISNALYGLENEENLKDKLDLENIDQIRNVYEKIFGNDRYRKPLRVEDMNSIGMKANPELSKHKFFLKRFGFYEYYTQICIQLTDVITNPYPYKYP